MLQDAIACGIFYITGKYSAFSCNIKKYERLDFAGSSLYNNNYCSNTCCGEIAALEAGTNKKIR